MTMSESQRTNPPKSILYWAYFGHSRNCYQTMLCEVRMLLVRWLMQCDLTDD